jgi:hydrogenase-4 component B
MMETTIILSIVGPALALLGGAIAFAAPTKRANAIGAASSFAGSVLGFAGAVPHLLGAPDAVLAVPWAVPGGTFALGLDPLAALFLVTVHFVCGLAAIYGAGYLTGGDEAEVGGSTWFAYAALTGSMALVILAQNALLFFLAWEVMSLSSWALVVLHHDEPSVREAGRVYLIATHLGAAFVLGSFLLLAGGDGSLDFDVLASTSISPGLATIVFACALIGFGAKAGLVPLHVWLPEAHPAAPSHVSAVMSGAMLKVAIYGLLRVLTLLQGPVPSAWGVTLVAIGIASGIAGVGAALAQHDLKRLLAYHSIENLGIITLGVGLGLLGTSVGSPGLAALGYAGALLHVVNHAIFKSLLFLGAGAVVKATGTRAFGSLGGLARKMPRTTALFLVGAVAICGLPPLNGFASELLLYLAAIRGGRDLSFPLDIVPLAVLPGLALMGGLALACFAKVVGIGFLGAPRGADVDVRDPGPSMILPMAILGISCVVIGAGAWALGPVLGRAVAALLGESSPTVATEALRPSLGALASATIGGGAIALLAALLALLRRALLRGRERSRGPTWGCGYSAPRPSMQYTGASFASNLLDLFGPALGAGVRVEPPEGLFPSQGSAKTTFRDRARWQLFGTLFAAIGALIGWIRRLQHGSVRYYALYIVATLAALLAWASSR